jgi:hypothetical protein
MKAEIVVADYCHIPIIAANVRDADRQELYDFCQLLPLEAIEQSFDAAAAVWTGMIDDIPMCMFGVTDAVDRPGVGIPWLITTVDIEQYSLTFLKHCRPVVASMKKEFKLLENYVAVNNILAITWLKWLGFKFGCEEEIGPFNKPFIKFWM